MRRHHVVSVVRDRQIRYIKGIVGLEVETAYLQAKIDQRSQGIDTAYGVRTQHVGGRY
jgi:hypothetical protein